MAKSIYRFFLHLGGWHYSGEVPNEKKYIVIAVPHTSMWDFVWGKLGFGSVGVSPAIFIKKEIFKFPLSYLLKALNAKPVNRGPGALSLVEQMLEHFNKNDKFVINITPEGTRNKVKKWKKGFYFISQKANVPIYLGFIDYKDKKLGIGERFIPTGNYQEDMKYIKEYYQKLNPQPKHPEKFNSDIA